MDFHKHQQSAQSLTVRGLSELFCLHMTMSVGPFDSAACAKVLSPGLQPLQGLVQGGLRRQPVEADAEDTHGPPDTRGEVGVARQPTRVLDLQGRKLHGRRFFHGALVRWIGDGFHASSPCVGHTSRALALMIGCEAAIGQKRNETQITNVCSAPTPKDVDFFACWTDADDVWVLCGAHRLQDWASVFLSGQVANLHRTRHQSKTAQRARRHSSTATEIHPRTRHTPHDTNIKASWQFRVFVRPPRSPRLVRCAPSPQASFKCSCWPGDTWLHVFGHVCTS